MSDVRGYKRIVVMTLATYQARQLLEALEDANEAVRQAGGVVTRDRVRLCDAIATAIERARA